MTHILLSPKPQGLPLLGQCKRGPGFKIPIPQGLPIVRGMPPKYIRFGGKVYECKGMGMQTYLYHESDISIYDIAS